MDDEKERVDKAIVLHKKLEGVSKTYIGPVRN